MIGKEYILQNFTQLNPNLLEKFINKKTRLTQEMGLDKPISLV